MDSMKVYFRDKNRDLVSHFSYQVQYSKADWYSLGIEFDINQGSPLDLEVDAIVSPANSFGFMDGGIDSYYIDRFGYNLQVTLQKLIRLFQTSRGGGAEVLVGHAIPVATNDENIPWVISAPTMRVPMRIVDPIDIFLATRAAIYQAKDLYLKSIAFPGMGTGAGQVPYDIACKAMVNGIYRAFMPLPYPKSWHEAYTRHINLER